MTKRRWQWLGLWGFTVTCWLLGAGPETVPVTSQPAQGEQIGAWSEVVNGLQFRISSLERSYNCDNLFVLVKNVGASPVKIPSLSVRAMHKDFPWQLQISNGQDWKDSPWEIHANQSDNTAKPNNELNQGVQLLPQETALMEVDGHVSDDLRKASRLRLVIQQMDRGPLTGWTGKLVTPSANVPVAENSHNPVSEKLVAPTYFPPFSDEETYFFSGSGGETPFEKLWASNWGLSAGLKLFQDEPICRELENRLVREKDLARQLLLAREAVLHGSIIGQKFIQNALQDLDYTRMCSTIDALGSLLAEEEPSDWVCATALSAIQNEQKVTNIGDQWAEGTTISVSRMTEGGGGVGIGSPFDVWLGRKKYQPAVPVFIKILQRDQQRTGIIEALGEIGDPAAIPELWRIVKSQQAKLALNGSRLEPANYLAALRALVALKDKDVTAELLNHAVNEDILWLLEKQADPRAIPVLKQIVATGKAQVIEGSSTYNDSVCVAVARIVLVALEPGDRVARYCSLMQDQSLDKYQRNEVLRRLALKENHDPRVIPILVKCAQEDADNLRSSLAVSLLGEYHHHDAVAGLISLLQINIVRKPPGKGTITPEEYQDEVAQALTSITGQKLGTDVQTWQKWWDQEPKGNWK